MIVKESHGRESVVPNAVDDWKIIILPQGTGMFIGCAPVIARQRLTNFIYHHDSHQSWTLCTGSYQLLETI
jgi:hypothetical protein